MKWFFDTSVLVAAFLDEHTHHPASLAAYLKADRADAACAAHSLAEIYATVTRMPGPHRATSEQALLLIDNIRERFTIVALDPDEYYAAIADAVAEGILGGTIYDVLIARCALRVKATTFYTWNVDHFRKCGAEIAKRIRTP